MRATKPKTMKIKIRGIEIEVSSLDELEQLLDRFGSNGAVEDDSTDRTPQGPGQTIPKHGRVSDAVVLKRLVEVGAGGMPTKELGEILGRRGKATMGAANEWALRIGLVSDDSHQAIERCRVGTQRGARIIPSLLEVAKAILERK